MGPAGFVWGLTLCDSIRKRTLSMKIVARGVFVMPGTNNTQLGTNALGGIVNGSGNSAVGVNAGRSITNGGNNVFFGFGAGYTGQSGTVNNAIGIG
jgi:hypothetical protein